MSLLLSSLLLSCPPQGPVAARFPGLPDQDARRYAIALRVDLEHRRVDGTVDYTFTAAADLHSITLDAQRDDNWQVTFTDAAGRPMKSAWQDGSVTLTLPEPARKGEDVRFSATLAGTPVDGFYFRDNRYGERMAFTDHYSIRARGWLPCEDHPGDRALFSLQLDYPEGLEAVGFGVPAPDAPPGAPAGYRRLVLRSDAEIPPYMFALAIGPLARVAEEGDPRLAPHLVYRQDVDKAKTALVDHAAWLAAMERTFGPYAYGKYTTVQCPTRWGGFEAPGNVQLAEGLFDDPARGRGTLAHELVHMWFGDAVGYAEWREVWLSEGFASYFGPWLHAQRGGPTLAQSLQAMRERWRGSFEGRTKSIRDDRFANPDQALNANTYPKGAWVLHMLRGELGEERFFAALRTYYETFRSRSITTADFVASIEKSAGVELGWFFTQWLDRVGCPELRVTPGDGAIVIEQVQAGEPYRCWLRLRWRDAAGQAVERRVRLEGAAQRVTVEGTPVDLQIDPEVELLFRVAR